MTVEYKITIRTAARLGAGTNAAIALTLVGEKGESEQYTLDKRFHNDFEAGAEDVYEFQTRDLGKLLLLRFTNPGGLAGDWLLDSVRVTAGEKSWYFPYFRWVLGHSTAEVLEGTARLPQHARTEREQAARKELIKARQQMYVWRPAEATTGLPGALDISKERPLPKDELYRGLTEGSYEIVFAKTMAAIKLNMPVLTKTWNGLVDIFEVFKSVELPKLAQRWQDDYEFARQAVQGISPVHIQLITALPEGFPLTDGELRGLLAPGTSLAQALAAKRIFLLDFEILEGISMYRKVNQDGLEE